MAALGSFCCAQGYCAMTVGSTGLGKSSLLRLYVGDAAQASSGSASCTKEQSVFSDLHSPNRKWLDTMGAEDSEGKEADEEILRLILRKIQDCGAGHVKVLWFVKQDVRSTPALQKQARFIGSLNDVQASDGPAQNIWDNVLIIVNQGLYDPLPNTSQGALCAAAEFGAPVRGFNEENEPIGRVDTLGYTCLDWLGESRAVFDVLPEPARSTMGYLTESVIVQVVGERLDAMQGFPMTFVVNQCEKCGQTGDPRCISAYCHRTKQTFHPSASNPPSLRFKHPGALRVFHLPHTRLIHVGSLEHVHASSGTYKKTTYTGNTEHRSSKSRKLACPYGHDTSQVNVNTGSFSCARCSKSFTKYVHHCSTCCDGAHGGNSRHTYTASCRGMFCLNTSGSSCTSYKSYYPCCGSESDSSGCRAETGSPETLHSCCSRPSGSVGCVQQYSCCHSNGSGCQREYRCCGGLMKNNPPGCQKEYACCSAKPGSQGCAHACCDRPTGEVGCKLRCQNCQTEWGTWSKCEVVEHVLHKTDC